MSRTGTPETGRTAAALPEYELIRSRRRTVSVEIAEGGRVIVRAPLRMPRRDIDFFVEDHAAWIERHRAARQTRDAAAETVELTPELLGELREAARAVLPGLAAAWAPRMGVRPAGITLTAALHRWGSCSSKGRVSFSVRVMLLPPEAREYIVVHELAHLREMNHSPRFWAVVAAALPDWKERQAAVRKYERNHKVIVSGHP